MDYIPLADAIFHRPMVELSYIPDYRDSIVKEQLKLK